MSDIFISYARSTETQAMQIAQVLRGLGYGVWRDDQIPAHRDFAKVIEERLSASKAVVVIWSEDAIESEWVRSEANRARADRKLIQLRVDGCRPPMPFDQIQCADLVGWTGEQDHPGWMKVTASVGDLVGVLGGSAPAPKTVDTPSPRRASVCVLPFANMSGDPEQEYFSDGISEDIITDLGKVSALFVVARNTAFTFKGKSMRVPEVARELGVAHVLEGGVRKAGDRVRITAQLIDGETGGHVWAERWDRDLTDIFALQDEISQAIVAALKVRLLPAEKKAIETRGTDSPEAYDLFLMAQKQTSAGNFSVAKREEIVRLCEAATKFDPGYARAWAMMGRAKAVLQISFGRKDTDPTAAIETALKLDPDLSPAHSVKAMLLFAAGHADEAVLEYETALRLDPESFEANTGAGRHQWRLGNYQRAAEILEKAITLNELEFDCPMKLFSTYQALGDAENTRRAAAITLARAEAAIAQDPGNAYAMGIAAYALGALGEVEKAGAYARRGLAIEPENFALLYNLATAYSRYLAEPDTAFGILRKLMPLIPINLFLEMPTDPGFAPLHGDPRFTEMLAMGRARFAIGES
jgi:adenylate cyclase